MNSPIKNKVPAPALVGWASVAIAAAFTTTAGFAQTASPVQSSVRPLGLDIVNQVMVGGSDTASADFQSNVLPGVTQLVNTQLSETHAINDSTMLLDPSKLRLKSASDVRVYFVGEGAGYRNTLGFTTDGNGTPNSSTAKLIFPNASSSVTTYNPGSNVQRTANEPLLPGDFVNLGTLQGGSLLDFFVIANGASGGTTSFSTKSSANPDGINHVVSFAYAMKDSPYLILGFEDLWGGGDRDFNDLIFAVDIGALNVSALTAAPEPAAWVSMMAFLGLGGALVRQRRVV